MANFRLLIAGYVHMPQQQRWQWQCNLGLHAIQGTDIEFTRSSHPNQSTSFKVKRSNLASHECGAAPILQVAGEACVWCGGVSGPWKLRLDQIHRSFFSRPCTDANTALCMPFDLLMNGQGPVWSWAEAAGSWKTNWFQLGPLPPAPSTMTSSMPSTLSRWRKWRLGRLGRLGPSHPGYLYGSSIVWQSPGVQGGLPSLRARAQNWGGTSSGKTVEVFQKRQQSLVLHLECQGFVVFVDGQQGMPRVPQMFQGLSFGRVRWDLWMFQRSHGGVCIFNFDLQWLGRSVSSLRLLNAYDCLQSADGRPDETIFGRKAGRKAGRTPGWNERWSGARAALCLVQRQVWSSDSLADLVDSDRPWPALWSLNGVAGCVVLKHWARFILLSCWAGILTWWIPEDVQRERCQMRTLRPADERSLHCIWGPRSARIEQSYYAY